MSSFVCVFRLRLLAGHREWYLLAKITLKQFPIIFKHFAGCLLGNQAKLTNCEHGKVDELKSWECVCVYDVLYDLLATFGFGFSIIEHVAPVEHVFTDLIPFLLPIQQRQCMEETFHEVNVSELLNFYKPWRKTCLCGPVVKPQPGRIRLPKNYFK